MRIHRTYWVVGFALVFLLFSFQEPKVKKRITDTSFKYEFYVTDKETEIKSDRIYYWFKGGAIHNSEYGISGELLDDTFDKFYLNNQLAEQGSFNRGLKHGLWKTWYANGVIETTQYWDNGRKKGTFYRYANDGQLMEKGRYKANKKHGQWINYSVNDTVTYKNNEKVVSKEPKKEGDDVEKLSFFKKIFTKKIKRVDEKDKSKLDGVPAKSDSDKLKSEKRKKASGQKASEKKTNVKKTEVKKTDENKKGFFQRLFSKKEKPNGKGA